MNSVKLSDEQEFFIEKTLQKKNILVDACIGSGKTTAIQSMCIRYIKKYKNTRILYLTYNKLLKQDAKIKIKIRGVQVTNYHGYAYTELLKIGEKSGIQNILQIYNEKNPRPLKYDLMVLDEYQDIEEDASIMLKHIAECNPDMQIVAVGDMDQKIYDKTRLHADIFISEFLGNHIRMEFTKCFRLSAGIASMLGQIWRKKIVGVNDNCKTCFMDFDKVKTFLMGCNPKDVLCLGQNAGMRSAMLNALEEEMPEKYNKYTVWSNITDNEAGATCPSSESAVFTTYDGCKGMERPICVLFDWTEAYWDARIQKAGAKYEIVRNIFCVAASRGKNLIIFVDSKDSKRLTKETILGENINRATFEDMQVSSMFDYKRSEDIEDAFKCLETKIVKHPVSEIPVKTSDGLIDLSSCVGIYQEAKFFDNYDIVKDIDHYFAVNKGKDARKIAGYDLWELEYQILYLISLESNQFRYLNQVDIPFVQEEQWKTIEKRLSSEFSKGECIQKPCQIEFNYENGKNAFTASGICDVIKERKDGVSGDAVYELKFVSELGHTHFLQCACYMIAFDFEVGYLYNVFNDEMHEIRIPDRKKFMDMVVSAVTKGAITKYNGRTVLSKYTGEKKSELMQKLQDTLDAARLYQDDAV